MVHGVIVRFKLRDADSFPAFWAAIEELYAYSRTSEPDTLLYELFRPEVPEGDGARTWTLLERYSSKSALMDVHFKSPVFQRFFAWANANGGTTPDANGVLPVLESVTMEHLEENPVVPARTPKVASSVHGVIVRFKLRDADAFPAFWAAIEELYVNARTNEPDTLLYEMFRPEVLEGDGARTWILLERYTSKSALTEVHVQAPVAQRFLAWVGANSGTTPDANGVLPVLESFSIENLTEVVAPPAVATNTNQAAGKA